MVDGVYGYVYVFDVTSLPPKQIASIPIFHDPKQRPHPGWITFSIDGRYAYPDGGVVIDTATKKVAARIPTSEKLIEIDFEDGRPVRRGTADAADVARSRGGLGRQVPMPPAVAISPG